MADRAGHEIKGGLRKVVHRPFGSPKVSKMIESFVVGWLITLEEHFLLPG